MPVSFDKARDEINSLFIDYFNNLAFELLDYFPEIRWQGVSYNELPDSSQFWLRVSKKTIQEKQTTFANCRRFTVSGLIFVEIFCPKSASRYYELGEKLAIYARDAFKGKTTPGGIWFRNVTIKEASPEDLYERLNVVAEFQYDDIG